MKIPILEEIQNLISKGVLHAGKPDLANLSALQMDSIAALPRDYFEFLGQYNGLISKDGYFRVFGVGADAAIDAVAWNRPTTWKDAWPDHLAKFWCFSETAWGDQYAFDQSSENLAVFFIEAVTMSPREVASDFHTFLATQFVRNVIEPFDIYLKAAQKNLGPLSASEHITYVPSILVSGAEENSSVQKMPAIASMVINGDLARQLCDESSDREIQRIDFQKDKLGRTRASVIWI